ncbi:MAG: hypothetical protein KKE62_13350 [Proteobacteria bacterium]|nr:hypothetical protein [Pseudomonadota bacterium]MBU1389807.1 hypothetical protein [Pseudomonadota bacterium]MBU1543816.1 hypothetical protein [Pseudomonadota bacterium]
MICPTPCGALFNAAHFPAIPWQVSSPGYPAAVSPKIVINMVYVFFNPPMGLDQDVVDSINAYCLFA